MLVTKTQESKLKGNLLQYVSCIMLLYVPGILAQCFIDGILETHDNYVFEKKIASYSGSAKITHTT